MPLSDLPKGFPATVPSPKFQIGDYICWQPQPTKDFGIVTGLHYASAQPLHSWAWKYTVWLSLSSPSQRWIKSDMAWESDLELVPITYDLTPEQP
ncbi:hypothetical protein C7B65_20760 [Phormidesmis priestleyi ULC007]|uniref:Uncharacterized protein n=1 Tax=Phormidesmis priestleyi ULC007 TaxID=1920490 RepID=A0A2T1D848_9CYAN|nr:hypothetical protein [Phormidesmis priestleyi]PSB16679.1 hypothetical protein C7B65_20760 [Phormidesmis priestleyi ULC007]PZO47620.1 MAG: hypothetical protein DCF14_19525 [Phormidesmis priestleyi]